MFWTERTRVLAALLGGALTTVSCQASREGPAGRAPENCQQKRALWDAEFPKVTAGPPAARIKAIEAIADRIGEDPEQCTADLVRKALQTERARLVTLRIGGSTIAVAAVYTCATISEDLKCVSSVADDTAHLGEAPTAAIFALAGGERVKLDADAYLAHATMRIYVAALSTLMDAPKYTELTLDDTSRFTMPKSSEQTVLLAIVNEPGSGMYDKFVWLSKPR
jgi:hypothetical protein